MNHPEAWESLQDFVDGRLPSTKRRRIERHLAECPTCDEEVSRLRGIIAAARELLADIAAGRDLWPEIAARISGMDPHAARGKKWLARATREGPYRFRRLLDARLLAPLTVAVGALIVILVISDEPRTERAAREVSPATELSAVVDSVSDPFALPASVDPAALSILAALDTEVRANDRALAKTAAAQASESDGALFDMISRNLRIVDQAVAEARSAWAANPESPQLVRLLTAAYRAKAALQGDALRMSSRA